MNSRERILTTLRHEEPDRVPFDLAGTTWSGISAGAYRSLLGQLELETEEPEWADVIQQIVVPSEKVMDLLEIDTRGLRPLTSHNWNVLEQLKEVGENWEYRDEWQFVHHFPREGGNWFTIVEHPMAPWQDPQAEDVDRFEWPHARDRRRIEGLREEALRHREKGKVVLVKGLCAGIFEMHQRVRGMTNALVEPFLYPEFSDRLIGKITDLKIAFWEMALEELSDVVDIVAEGDDYGTQSSQLISPDHFRQYYKPHLKRLTATIRRKAPEARVMFHSCGNVRPVIPDFIEAGIDILNPVHITATGMEARQLKKDFGNDLVFWGGGVDTQQILPSGTPEQVREDVKRNMDALAPGGGFVFTTVHNIQSEVPGRNIMAMWNAYRENRAY